MTPPQKNINKSEIVPKIQKISTVYFSKVCLSNVYFCKRYPTCMSSKLLRVYWRRKITFLKINFWFFIILTFFGKLNQLIEWWGHMTGNKGQISSHWLDIIQIWSKLKTTWIGIQIPPPPSSTSARCWCCCSCSTSSCGHGNVPEQWQLLRLHIFSFKWLEDKNVI